MINKLEELCREMIAYDKGDPRRIHHFLKVHAFAEQIGREEGIPEKRLFVLEAAAYVHDIGIHRGEMEFGRNDGKIQEELGPGKRALYWKDSDSRRKILTASAGWSPIIIPTGV